VGFRAAPSLVEGPHTTPPGATVARGGTKLVKPAKPEPIPLQVPAAACRSARHQERRAERHQTISMRDDASAPTADNSAFDWGE
jgi:hypothetical protein